MTVARVLGNEITLSDNLNNDFWDANEANWQIITMTNYGVDGVRLVGDVLPLAWDGDNGGIVSVYAIAGHTDNVGSDSYNKRLSQKRADAIKEILIHSHNIAPKRVKAVGYGESMPVADNGTVEGRAKNRRVEARIDTIVETPDKL